MQHVRWSITSLGSDFDHERSRSSTITRSSASYQSRQTSSYPQRRLIRSSPRALRARAGCSPCAQRAPSACPSPPCGGRWLERERVGWGERVELGGGRIIKKKKKQ